MVVGGVLLFVVGAILAFGVSFAVPGVSMWIIGIILMIAGAVLFIVGLVAMMRRRGATTVSRTAVDPATGNSVRSTTTDTDPLP
jgi:membrane protein implicated in regulation of membrane protease activity